MVKRILENGKYLGTDIYPRLVSDEDFLAVQLQRKGKNTYTPRPASLNPIREKAVWAVCGKKITRDTRNHGRSRWVCGNSECGTIVRIDDDALQECVTERLHQLAAAPTLLTPPNTSETALSMDALRIENELNSSFNRSDISANYMKTLIFAIAAERYAILPDPILPHELATLRERLEQRPASEADLRELLTKAVKHIHIGGHDYIELEVINGEIIGKEALA